MKSHFFPATILIIVCCAAICLCSCGKKQQSKHTIDMDTLRLMQKTQMELAACVERCRSAAKDSRDKEFLLALANSQQVLADRHATIINILLKKYKLEKFSTASNPVEMDPRIIVHAPLNEYRNILAKADPEKMLREVLITLEITNKVLMSDLEIELLANLKEEDLPDIDFYLCPVCGHLTLGNPEENCPVCHSDKDRQIELKDGELPPREEGTFVTVAD